MDFADSALVFAARAGYSSLGPAQPQQTFVCFLLMISELKRDSNVGGMPLLSLFCPTLTTLKLVAGNLVPGGPAQ